MTYKTTVSAVLDHSTTTGMSIRTEINTIKTEIVQQQHMHVGAFMQTWLYLSQSNIVELIGHQLSTLFHNIVNVSESTHA